MKRKKERNASTTRACWKRFTFLSLEAPYTWTPERVVVHSQKQSLSSVCRCARDKEMVVVGHRHRYYRPPVTSRMCKAYISVSRNKRLSVCHIPVECASPLGTLPCGSREPRSPLGCALTVARRWLGQVAVEGRRVVGNVRQNLQLIFILLLGFVTFTNIDEGLWNHEILMLREEL